MVIKAWIYLSFGRFGNRARRDMEVSLCCRNKRRRSIFTYVYSFYFIDWASFINGGVHYRQKDSKDAVESYMSLAPGSLWHWVGRLGIITCFILLSFYSVVGGWIIIYIVKGLTGELSRSTDYAGLFGETIANPYLVLGSQFAFIIITILVVAKGVRSGIEKASKFMMPALFIIFLLLIVRSLTLPGSMEGLEFFLKPDLSHIKAETVLFALGQSFFSLSVGVSVMVTYRLLFIEKRKPCTVSRFSDIAQCICSDSCRVCDFSGRFFIRIIS